MLGYQRYKHEIDKLKNYSSKLFEVTEWLSIEQLPSSNSLNMWGYSDNQLTQILKTNNIDNSNVDLCMCFIDSPIECNYFSRELPGIDEKTVVCSFSGVEDILNSEDIEFFNFLHEAILYRVVLVAAFHTVNENHLTHDDTRNCLFDMCGMKKDIALKCSAPHLCPECKSKIGKKAMDPRFLPSLEKEFTSFKKPLFNRILDFVKRRPIVSILITIVSSIIFNLLSSLLYDLIKAFFV